LGEHLAQGVGALAGDGREGDKHILVAAQLVGERCHSRSALGLEDCRWSELLHRQYLGVLGDDGVDEGGVKRCSVDVERTLRDGCTLKLHAGPGRVRRNVRTAEGGVQTVQEPEVRFMLDLDLFFLETVRLGAAAERMETLHRNADEVFADAISDRLHGAMEPVVL